MNLKSRIEKIEQNAIPEDFFPKGWEKDAGTAIIINQDETKEQAIARWEKAHGRPLNLLYAKNGIPNILFVTIAQDTERVKDGNQQH